MVIAFSSFKDGTDYDIALKDDLSKRAQELGASIQSEPQFEPQITHVVRVFTDLNFFNLFR